jgi:hypothetical protein
MLCVGVVAMFVAAGCLAHARFLIEFDSTSTVIIAWTFVTVTTAAVLALQRREDNREKQKKGPYNRDYADQDGKADLFFKKIESITQQQREMANRMALQDQVRKAPSWFRSWSNVRLLLLRSHRNAWADLHFLGQPNTFLAPEPH